MHMICPLYFSLSKFLCHRVINPRNQVAKLNANPVSVIIGQIIPMKFCKYYLTFTN
jgi:hypothetical protein